MNGPMGIGGITPAQNLKQAAIPLLSSVTYGVAHIAANLA